MFRKESFMSRYFMRDTPLWAMERLMMSQPGHKPRRGGIYRNQFHYTPKDVECEYCQNYARKNPCLLCECTCLEERIEAGVLELNEFVRDCFASAVEPQLQERMYQQFRERKSRFFLSDTHRRRWTHWRALCWRLSDRNKAALFLLTAYESLWRRMVWKCGNDGLDDFYDYEGYAQQRINDEDGMFTDRGYIAYKGHISLEEVIENYQGNSMEIGGLV